jgi:hypothetical protein
MASAFCNRCDDPVEEGWDPLDELAELDALSGVSEPLMLKRYDLKRKINHFHSPIVSQLPPDVMSTIFEFCLPDFADHQPSLTVYPEEDPFIVPSIPLSLGAICSYWREIAWSTPSLWSSLVVRVPVKLNSHRVTSIAEEWLARSGQLPLSIRIFSKPNSNTVTVVSALADIINRYSTRWYDLDLRVPEYYFRCFHATDNHAPILKFIRFRCSESTRTIYLDFQLTCPRLERASFLFFPVDGTNIQWDNLTHLTLRVRYIEDSFLILRKTPQLVFCNVSEYLGYRPITPIALISLNSLRTLRLPIMDLAGFFLDNIIAPHLEELSLPHNYSLALMEDITSFLRRSACSLHSFSILFSNFPPYTESFMNLLQSMPLLNTLSLISVTTDSDFEDITTPEDYDPRNILRLVAEILSSQNTSHQQGFLPNLKTLEYTGRFNLRPGNYSDLYSLPPADAVHGPFHLLKLELHPATRIPENMISYISSLVERGVTVKVLSDSKDILQSSIDYYRCRKESLCRDWADNLDSSIFSWGISIEK